MGYSTRVAERRGRVHADANGDTPNALAKQQSFCAGLDHQCDDGDSEGISTVKGPEDFKPQRARGRSRFALELSG